VRKVSRAAPFRDAPVWLRGRHGAQPAEPYFWWGRPAISSCAEGSCVPQPLEPARNYLTRDRFGKLGISSEVGFRWFSASQSDPTEYGD